MKYAQLFIFTVQSQSFEPSICRHSRFFEPVVVNSLGFASVRFYLLFFLTKFSFPRRLKIKLVFHSSDLYNIIIQMLYTK